MSAANESDKIPSSNGNNIAEDNKYRLKGYRNGNIWTSKALKSKDMDDTVIKQGNSLCPELFEELIQPEKIVTTEWEALRKTFKKENNGEWKLSFIRSIPESRIL